MSYPQQPQQPFNVANNSSVYPSNPAFSPSAPKDVQGTFIKPYVPNTNTSAPSTPTLSSCNFVGQSPSPPTNFVVPQVQGQSSPASSPRVSSVQSLPSSSVPSSPVNQSQPHIAQQIPASSHSSLFPNPTPFSNSLPLASCSMCGSSTSPSSLKHGPPGRSGVCEVCFEKWNLRQLTLAQANAKQEYKKIMSGAVNNTNNNNNVNNTHNNHYSQMEEDIDGSRISRRPRRSTHRPQHLSSISSPMSESDDDYTDNPHLTPSSSIFPDSPDTHSSYESHPSSPPIDSREAGNGKDYYFCKYCETTWPLTFFRNRQQFGAHCSNCSRRRRPRDPTVMIAGTPAKKSRTDDGEVDDRRFEERHTPRFPKPTAIHAEDKHHDVNSAFNTPILFGLPKGGDNAFGGDMLERLLNVVEGKLIEETELEGIKSELARMRKELIKREELNASKIEEVIGQLMGFVRNLRVHIASELTEFEESGINVVDEITGTVLEELKGLSFLKSAIERRFDDMKEKMGNNTRKVESTVVTEISKCEELIQDRLTKLNKDMSRQTDDLKKKLAQMERALRDDARAQSKAGKPSPMMKHSKSRESPLIPKRNFSESIYYPTSPQQ
eukprot:TRINITY_DN6109_c0_g1_i3.p1 TRINITY_DN6109_c0_g1~~TRINITY_DN6109_c0_g1_i3.p1  ORF type:complete len:607 (-),score=130.68 TRINITY_DN6109_c0_g1_i3:366-2186(-)